MVKDLLDVADRWQVLTQIVSLIEEVCAKRNHFRLEGTAGEYELYSFSDHSRCSQFDIWLLLPLDPRPPSAVRFLWSLNRFYN